MPDSAGYCHCGESLGDKIDSATMREQQDEEYEAQKEIITRVTLWDKTLLWISIAAAVLSVLGFFIAGSGRAGRGIFLHPMMTNFVVLALFLSIFVRYNERALGFRTKYGFVEFLVDWLYEPFMLFFLIIFVTLLMTLVDEVLGILIILMALPIFASWSILFLARIFRKIHVADNEKKIRIPTERGLILRRLARTIMLGFYLALLVFETVIVFTGAVSPFTAAVYYI